MVLVIAALAWGGRQRDRFVSRQARDVYRGSRELFERGDPSFSEYRARLPGADAVTFVDTRRLWRDGRLTPEAVQKTLQAH